MNQDSSSPKTQIPNVRQRIMSAASKLFTEKGYAETTTRSIASAANVNEATIFHYFGSKMELFRSVYLQNTPTLASLPSNNLTNSEDLQAALYQLFREYTLMCIKHIPNYKLSVQQVDEPENHEFYRMAMNRLEHTMTHLLTNFNNLKDSKKVIDINYTALTELLFSVFLCKAPEFMRDKKPSDEYNEEMVEHFVNSYSDYVYKLIAAELQQKGVKE